jgi:acyl-CoA dehydrogenase
MEFELSDRAKDFREQLQAFLAERVYPVERDYVDAIRSADTPHVHPPIIEELKEEARRRGLWNLFLPDEEHGAGLTNLEYASLAELMGRTMIGAEVCNCSAPDTGNMEVLHQFGNDEQKDRWLRPLLDGEIRSGFAMTEPDVASSDATNIALRMERDGDDFVLNGRKWWTTGVMHPHCRVLIVMGKTELEAPVYAQQSMLLVPLDTPGLEIVRSLPVFGYMDPEGHAELRFTDVRVPASNLIGEEGTGFAIAQARLGPGRIHHCMRSIGIAEVAIEAMCRRASERVAFGRPIAEQGVVRDWIAESRVRVEQLRLLVLKTAWLMDTVGNKGAHSEIQAIKIATPRTVEWILDKAIQTHGAAGLSQDTELAVAFAGIRTLRFADGPDEVHKNALAKAELRKHAPATPTPREKS